MTDFRTKGRGRNRQVFPVSEGKEYRKDYSQDFQAKPDKPKPTKQHHTRNPSWSAKHTVKGDIKDMYRADRPENPPDHSEDQRLYKKRVQSVVDKEIVHQDKKQTKKQEKLLKKQEKQTIKQAKKEYADDQKSEQETREEIETLEGNR